MHLSFPIAVSWSLAGLWGAAAASDGSAALENVAILTMAVVGATESFRPAWRAVLWSSPFMALLLLVHGVIGPLFPVDGHIAGLPWRSAGIDYALQIGCLIISSSMTLFLWHGIARDDVIDDLIWLRLPRPLIMAAGQSLATIALLRRRTETVFLAQRARGIPVDGAWFQRCAALPSVLLPVVVSVLVEANERSLMLVSRGFSEGHVAHVTPRAVSLKELLLAAAFPVVVVVVQCAR